MQFWEEDLGSCYSGTAEAPHTRAMPRRRAAPRPQRVSPSGVAQIERYSGVTQIERYIKKKKIRFVTTNVHFSENKGS